MYSCLDALIKLILLVSAIYFFVLDPQGGILTIADSYRKPNDASLQNVWKYKNLEYLEYSQD